MCKYCEDDDDNEVSADQHHYTYILAHAYKKHANAHILIIYCFISPVLFLSSKSKKKFKVIKK